MSVSDALPDESPGPVRQRDSERTKRAILKAAGHRFARSGYSRVSLQQIAGDAGVTAAMVNHHFGSKLQLFAEVARDVWDLDDATTPVGADDAKTAEELVDFWNDPDARSSAFALIRSLDVEAAVEMFRQELERRIAVPWADRYAGPHAEERLRVLEGIVMGLGFFTTGVLLDPDAAPLDEERRQTMIRLVTRILEALGEDLNDGT